MEKIKEVSDMKRFEEEILRKNRKMILHILANSRRYYSHPLLRATLSTHLFNIFSNAFIHRRGRLNLPENDLLYAFGRIQSAPTGYVNEMCRKNSLERG